jgi:membrane protein
MAEAQAREERGRDADAGRAPDTPAKSSKRSWIGVLKRTVKQYKQDNLGDWAAALTYYAILSIFPALLALVSVLGLLGQNSTQALIDNLGSVAPGPAKDIATNAIKNLQKSQGAAGVLFFVGIAGALWSASGYVAAFMRAANAIYDVGEGRPIWKKLPTRVLTTVVLLAMLAVVAVGVTVTGPLAREVGTLFGLSDQAVTIWNIAKWPVILAFVITMFAFLYYMAPNVKTRFQWISPGGTVGVLLWILASLVFAFYVANFGSYNKTYGSLGGVIVFLVWLWISNIAVLLGAEFNAEVERGRQIEAGLRPEDQEPLLEPRDTKKLDDEEKEKEKEKAQGLSSGS